jgi:hypothetical protein
MVEVLCAGYEMARKSMHDKGQQGTFIASQL